MDFHKFYRIYSELSNRGPLNDNFMFCETYTMFGMDKNIFT